MQSMPTQAAGARSMPRTCHCYFWRYGMWGVGCRLHVLLTIQWMWESRGIHVPWEQGSVCGCKGGSSTHCVAGV